MNFYAALDMQETITDTSIAKLEHNVLSTNYKILVVSAKDSTRVSVENTLKNSTKLPNVRSYRSVEECVEYLNKNDVNLILSSYRFDLGNMDGRNLFDYLKTNNKTSSFIMIDEYTIYEASNLRRAGILLLPKPFNTAKIDKISKLLYVRYLTDLLKNK